MAKIAEPGYVRNVSALVSAENSELPAARRSIASFIGASSGCDGVLATTVPASADRPISEFILGGAFSAFIRPFRHAEHVFAIELANEKWNGQRLRELAHAELIEYKAGAGAYVPDICPLLREWAATGFKLMPTKVTEYLASVRPLVVEAPEPRAKILALLSLRHPAEDQAIKSLIRKEAPLNGVAFRSVLAADGTIAHGLSETK